MSIIGVVASAAGGLDQLTEGLIRPLIARGHQALTVLVEGLGSTPMVVFPRANAAHARHPAWAGHLAVLRSAGAHLIDWELREPGEAAGRPLPWDRILEGLLGA